jgi:hypothetical protein
MVVFELLLCFSYGRFKEDVRFKKVQWIGLGVLMFLWPLVIAIAIIVSPFWWAFIIGKKIRKP